MAGRNAYAPAHAVSRTAQRGIALAAALAAALVWQPLSRLIWQMVFALGLTALALPIDRRIEKRLSKGIAALLSVGTLVLLLLGLVALLVPLILEQARLIIAQAPRLLQQAQAWWEDMRKEEWLLSLTAGQDLPGQWLNRAAGWIGESLPGLINLVGMGFDTVSRAFLSPLLAFYFLRDREMFSYQLSLWIPAKHRKKVLAALQGMRREAGGYVRGQLLVALAVAVLTALGLMIVGIPAWLVLGIVMGLCELIPYVGPLIGGVPIAVFSLPLGMTTTFWALGVTILIQQIEGFFLSPFLMAGATGLHPVCVVLLLTAGGLLMGLPGMMIVLPAFLCVRGGIRVLRTADGP